MTLRSPKLGLWCLLLTLPIGPIRASAEESPLTLADLEAYRLALATRPDGPAPPVRFRDLWDRPEAYAGRVVKVEGKVGRIFQQGRLGEFPPLVEAWVVSPTQDPFCLVFPRSEGQPSTEIGASVQFLGTFLKRVKYQAGDTARLAPLLVGPQGPVPLLSGPETSGTSWSPADWMMGVGGLVVFATILARRHLARPIERRSDIGPPPAFFDGERVEEGDHEEFDR